MCTAASAGQVLMPMPATYTTPSVSKPFALSREATAAGQLTGWGWCWVLPTKDLTQTHGVHVAFVQGLFD
jgi:hypothetical protein